MGHEGGNTMLRSARTHAKPGSLSMVAGGCCLPKETDMHRPETPIALVIALACAVGTPGAAETSAPDSPEAIPHLETIFARRVMMGTVDIYMQEIEAFIVDYETDDEPIPFEAAEAADILSSLLIGLAQLYPTGTDFWSEAAEEEDPTSVTHAMPAVWENFDDFYARMNAASQLAFDLSRSTPRNEDWVVMANELRGTCVSCHTDYSRFDYGDPPVPPEPIRD